MTETKKIFKRGYSIRSGIERRKIHAPLFLIKDNKDIQTQRYITENQSQTHNKNSHHNKLKSQTGLNQNQNLFEIPEKIKPDKKYKEPITDKKEDKSPSPKKISQKKFFSPKKVLNSVKTNDKKYSNIFQKNNKKNKEGSNSIKKFISGGIINKKKIFNNNDNSKNNNIAAPIISTFKISTGKPKKPVNKIFKRANTGINKIYHFRGNEIKLKENNF